MLDSEEVKEQSLICVRNSGFDLETQNKRKQDTMTTDKF